MRHSYTFNARKQRGVVLFITLIALVVLLLSAVALIRSTDTGLALAGNIAVKRDMTNQAEQAIGAAQNQFTVGALSAPAARNANITSANYSSVMLDTNAEGIPKILLDTASNFNASFGAPALTSNNGVTYRYVIDRMCSQTGAPDPRYCATAGSTLSGRSQTDWLENAKLNTGGIVYRITVRVTDPKQAQSFIQSTIAI